MSGHDATVVSMKTHERTPIPLPPRASIQAVADHYDVSTKTIRRAIAEGRIKGIRVGRLIRIDTASLASYEKPMGGGR